MGAAATYCVDAFREFRNRNGDLWRDSRFLRPEDVSRVATTLRADFSDNRCLSSEVKESVWAAFDPDAPHERIASLAARLERADSGLPYTPGDAAPGIAADDADLMYSRTVQKHDRVRDDWSEHLHDPDVALGLPRLADAANSDAVVVAMVAALDASEAVERAGVSPKVVHGYAAAVDSAERVWTEAKDAARRSDDD